MTEHYTSRTESVLAWCDKCARNTDHAVSGKRRGRCMEHDTIKAPKAKKSETQFRFPFHEAGA